MREEGLERLLLHRLAAELATGPASPYLSVQTRPTTGTGVRCAAAHLVADDRISADTGAARSASVWYPGLSRLGGRRWRTRRAEGLRTGTGLPRFRRGSVGELA